MASRTEDFQELLAAFAEHGVRALIVGGYAFAYHVEPRFTKDFDVFVEPTPENASRVVAALRAFIGDLGLESGDFDKPGQIVQLGVAPWRIDIITSIEAVSFEEAWAERVQTTFHGRPAAYLSRAHLLRNKEAVARPRDLLDAERLREWGGD